MRAPAPASFVAILGACLAAAPASAHFGMVIPDSPMVAQEDGSSVRLELSFSHPFERLGMTLARPVAFTVTRDGETVDLMSRLEEARIFGEAGYVATAPLERPGAHAFAMTPAPYWEPAEDAFIIHYAKTYVAAYDDDSGWDAMLGLPVEIAPLTRPFGLWAGNLFQGRVLIDGAPAPFAEVEVEHYPLDAPGSAPSDLMITQTIIADADGVFSYVAPRAGWWGFAALTTSDETMPHEGVDKAVELGGVLWVRFEPWAAD